MNLSGRIVTLTQLGEFLPIGDEKSKFFDLYRKTYLANSKKNIKHKVYKALGLYHDTLSITTYLAILKRYLLDSDTLIPLSEQGQYFEDVYQPSENEVFVDLGGFTGDTLEVYLQKVQNKFKAYHIFEPCPENFEILQTNISSFSMDVQKKIHSYPVGASHIPSTVEFLKDGSGAGGTIFEISNEEARGKLEQENLVTIRVEPLDTVLKGVEPTFIKLDIEGYEAFAITGARELIKTHRPVIALCVYHHSYDLWDLPLLVKRFCGENYRYYLRAYTDIWEYVCYCVPEERVNPIWK